MRRIAILTTMVMAGPLLAAGPGGEPGDLSQARPYQVVAASSDTAANGRTVMAWEITSSSSTLEEHAQTIVRAALDLDALHRADLNRVTLRPTAGLVGSGVRYGHGYYASDGKAGQGFPGADPHYRARWRVFATDRELTDQELAVAELWVAHAVDFPSRSAWSSSRVDIEALRRYVSDRLGIAYEEAVLPELPAALWLEVID